MATICQWSETRSYGEMTYRVEKLENETIEVQQHTARYGWVMLESFPKGRTMAKVLEKLGSMTSAIVEEEGEQDES